MRAFSFVAALAILTLTAAKTIVITVGGNTTANASMVFQPETVTAVLNDIVIFNFTQGNHTVTQSLFATPCLPANVANSTINGFNSDFRDAGNGTAITILSVPITPEIENQTLWFYDFNTCGQGGVGGINVNESSFQNTAAFIRNAKRLNGTSSTSSSSDSGTSATDTSTQPLSTGDSSSSATRTAVVGAMAALPMALLALAL